MVFWLKLDTAEFESKCYLFNFILLYTFTVVYSRLILKKTLFLTCIWFNLAAFSSFIHRLSMSNIALHLVKLSPGYCLACSLRRLWNWPFHKILSKLHGPRMSDWMRDWKDLRSMWLPIGGEPGVLPHMHSNAVWLCDSNAR